jgi:hypothetical protein
MVLVDDIGIFFYICNTFGHMLYMHARSLSYIGADTTIKHSRNELVL